MRIPITGQYLETDNNDRLRLVLVDINGQEWSVSEENTGHGFITKIVKKEDCFYFKKANIPVDDDSVDLGYGYSL